MSETLKREDIKKGDKLEMSMGPRTMDVEVIDLNGKEGFITPFGPVPWSKLHLLRRKGGK